MISRRTLLAAGAALLLAGCAAADRNVRVCRGRFSLRAVAQGRAESHSGRFELLSRPGLLRLDLLTPLSGVVLRVESTPTGASIERPGAEPPIEGPNLHDLMLGTLGFPLPMDALEALISSNRRIEDDSEADGWRFRVLSRAADGSPKNLRITRATPHPVTITLAVEKALP